MGLLAHLLPGVVLALAVILIGFTKSGFGSGAGLLVVPMAAMAGAHLPGLGESGALGMLLPLLILGDLIAVGQFFRTVSRRHVIGLLPGTVIGVTAAAFFLRWMHNQTAGLSSGLIRTEIGIESLLLVSLSWWRAMRGAPPVVKEAGVLQTHLTGGFSGVSSTLAHAAGPIVALYLLPRGLDRRHFVGTSAAYFMIVNAIKVPGYVAAGILHAGLFQGVAMAAPLVVGGAIAGRWLNNRISDKAFSRAVLIATFVSGIYLLGDGGLLLSKWYLAR
jgi:uncharacterized membrane protein YfcA